MMTCTYAWRRLRHSRRSGANNDPFLVPGSWFRGRCNQEPGTRNQELGTRNHHCRHLISQVSSAAWSNPTTVIRRLPASET